MQKGLPSSSEYSISFVVVTSDGTRVDPDESNTIMLPVGTRFSPHVRDVPQGCNGGLAYFTYGGSIFKPHEYAMVREGRLELFGKAVVNTPVALAYVHEYVVYIQDVLPPPPNKKDGVRDSDMYFILVDAKTTRRHPLREMEPLTLESGTLFRIEATTPIHSSQAYVSCFEYNSQRACVGTCTVVDGKQLLIVAGYRHLSSKCGDVIATERVFTIVGQPPEASLSEEKTKMTDKKGCSSSSSKSFDLFVETRDDHDNLLNKYRVVDGRVEVPAGERFRFVVTSYVERQGADAPSFVYRNEIWKSKHTYMPRVTREQTLAVVAVAALHPDGSAKSFERVPVTIVPILNDGGDAAVVEKTLPLSEAEEKPTTKMTDAKEGSSSSSYELFVETCDDDPVCYPVVDGRVEVPMGTRFRFVATSNVQGYSMHAQSFEYHGDGMTSHPYCVSARVTRHVQVARVHVIENKTTDGSVSMRRMIDVIIVPILNDRSGAAAPVVDVEVTTPPLGKDVERERNGVVVMGLAAAKPTEKDVLSQLVFYNRSQGVFAYDSDTRTVVIPTGFWFRVGTACSEHKIKRCTYHNNRTQTGTFAFVATQVPGTLKIHVSVAPSWSCTAEVKVIPHGIKAEYDGIILTEPCRKGRVVPSCADAEGISGKRFIPPWNDKERACEECFLTRVVDPRGWMATTGSGACNYTPMRVWLERAGDDDMPFAENEEGDYLVPYGTKVMAKTDRGEICQVKAGGIYHRHDAPFVFAPIAQCPAWDVYVKVTFPGGAPSCQFTFRLRPAESDDELKAIWEHKRIENAIRNTTATLNHERESLERTWEKIQSAQDKLTELKVEQAKLAQTK